MRYSSRAIRALIRSVVLVSAFVCSASAGTDTNGTIAVLGSSVAKGLMGGGSIIDGSYANGYAGLLTTYLAPLEWGVTNLSVSGNTTSNVLDRFDADVLPADPDQVLIGLSLSNENLAGAADPDAVVETFRSGMTNIIDRIRSNGMYAMTGLCYPNDSYSASEYQYLKDMNLLINSWDLPSANFLGAVDDGNGHWAEGYGYDSVHPNAAGHQEMFYAIVPSLFDAIRLGKAASPASVSVDKGYAIITRDETVHDPVSFNPDDSMHSFTTAFRVRSSSTGTVAAVLQSSAFPETGVLGDNRILVDFGPSNDDDGRATPSPDSRGNYWNNWRPAAGDAFISVGTTLSNLITADNGTATPVGLEITAAFQSNGIKNGGLLTPDYALLGDFAVTNATEDYFHIANGTGSFKITGLDAGVQYTLRIFATRMQTETRITRYTAHAANGTFSANLNTSGTDIGADGYDGNNNKIVQLVKLEADGNGEIELDVSNASSAYGYIGIMEISETKAQPLEISDSILVDFGPSDDYNGRAAPSPDAWDHYWNSWRPAAGGASIPSGTSLADLVKTNGTCSSVGLQVTAAFNSNGRNNGGLLYPSSSLLGCFAVTNATEDYFFSSSTSSLKITGLDPQFKYTLRFFGTRAANDSRITKYTVYAGNGSYSTNLVTTGSGVGDSGYNGNNNVIPELHDLLPDAYGNINVSVSVVQGGYAYLGIMELVVEEIQSGDEFKSLALNDRILVDFGTSNDDDGRAAPSPDQNGNYWNNWRPLSGGITIPAGTSLSGIITTSDDVLPTVALEVTSPFTGSNGRQHGGLTNPVPVLLGDFAVTNATEDYFYKDSNNGIEAGFKIIGLDPQFTYGLRFFGTRQESSIRKTRYTVNGANGSFVTDLQTSGTDIGTGGYDGNNDTIVGVDGVIPDENGEISVDLTVVQNIAYIGIMELTVSGTAPVMTGAVGRILVDLGPDNDAHGHATASPDPEFGNYWNSWRPTDNQVPISTGTSLHNLVRSDNGMTTYVSLVVTSPFVPTGIQNGGLTDPDSGLLGDFAVGTATEDYFYGTGGFKVCGLNPDGVYTLRFFGTRNTTDIRETRYTATTGNGTFSVDLITSGTDVGTDGYDGNNDTVAELTGLVPDVHGEIAVKLSIVQGAHCHIGILEINETGTVAGNGQGSVELRENSVVYMATTGHEIVAPVDAVDNKWHDVAISHCYARQQTLLFVDGVQAGAAVEQIVPVSFVLGGEGLAVSNRMTCPLTANYQDWCVYRSAWNEDEAAAQAAGSLQQASMEICAALDDSDFIQGEAVENRAQSLSEAVVNSPLIDARLSGMLFILK